MAPEQSSEIDTAVEEVMQMPLQDQDPLECLTNTQVAEVYSRLNPPDQKTVSTVQRIPSTILQPAWGNHAFVPAR